MSLCLIKPAEARGRAKCGPQGSECSEGRGSSVCLQERQVGVRGWEEDVWQQRPGGCLS